MKKQVYHLIICDVDSECDRLVLGSIDIFPEYHSHVSESAAASLYAISKSLGCTNKLRLLLSKLLKMEFSRLR